MEIFYHSKLHSLHNPDYTYRIQGREEMEYPETGNRIERIDLTNHSCTEVMDMHQQTKNLLTSCLDANYYQHLKKGQEILGKKTNNLKNESFLDFLSPESPDLMDCLYASVSLCLTAIDQIAQGNYRHAYVLCRPPGHHASRGFGGGFCYINNLGVSLDYLRLTMKWVKRVAVIDLDLHFGNGTVDYLKAMPFAKYFSIHMDAEICYPYITKDEKDKLDRLNSNTCMIELEKHSQENEYMKALDNLLMKVESYQPDILMISMGYDTHQSDPCNGFLLQYKSYYHIAKTIVNRFSIPIVVFHEGGYNLHVADRCFQSFIEGAESQEGE